MINSSSVETILYDWLERRRIERPPNFSTRKMYTNLIKPNQQQLRRYARSYNICLGLAENVSRFTALAITFIYLHAAADSANIYYMTIVRFAVSTKRRIVLFLFVFRSLFLSLRSSSTRPCTWHPTRASDRSTCPCAHTGTTAACGAFTIRTADGTNRPRPVNPISPGKSSLDPWKPPDPADRSLVRRLLQDVTNSSRSVCESSVVNKRLTVTFGQSVHLSCFVKMPQVLKVYPVTWYHHSKEKGRYMVSFR